MRRRLGDMLSGWSGARLFRAFAALMIVLGMCPSFHLQAQMMSGLVAPTGYEQQSQAQVQSQSMTQFQIQSQPQPPIQTHQDQQQQLPPQPRSELVHPIHQEPQHPAEQPAQPEGQTHTQPPTIPLQFNNSSQTQQQSQPQQPPGEPQQPRLPQLEQRPAQMHSQPQAQLPVSKPQHAQAPQILPLQQQQQQQQSMQPNAPPQAAPSQIQQQPQQPQPRPQQQPQPQTQLATAPQTAPAQTTPSLKYQPSVLSPLYLGHNPFIEILRPLSYADDNIVTLNLSHSHIYEIDSEAFVGQRFEHIDLSNNKLGLIHSKSFRIGPNHSRYNSPHPNNTKSLSNYASRRPPPAHPKSVTIDLSHNPAIVALSGAFDHIDVPNCLLNFTNSTVELKYGSFKKYLKEHPGHLIDIDTVDCCEQEWLLGYKHNFVARTHCAHDPNLYLLRVPQQTIIDSCIAYVTSASYNLAMPSSGIIHLAATNGPRHSSSGHADNQQYLTYMILGGTAMILTSLSIYIIFYMFSLKAAFVNQMQTQENKDDKDSDVGVSNWHVSRYDMATAATSSTRRAGS